MLDHELFNVGKNLICAIRLTGTTRFLADLQRLSAHIKQSQETGNPIAKMFRLYNTTQGEMALDLEQIWSNASAACLIAWESPSFHYVRILISEVCAKRFMREIGEEETKQYMELAAVLLGDRANS